MNHFYYGTKPEIPNHLFHRFAELVSICKTSQIEDSQKRNLKIPSNSQLTKKYKTRKPTGPQISLNRIHFYSIKMAKPTVASNGSKKNESKSFTKDKVGQTHGDKEYPLL